MASSSSLHPWLRATSRRLLATSAQGRLPLDPLCPGVPPPTPRRGARDGDNTPRDLRVLFFGSDDVATQTFSALADSLCVRIRWNDDRVTVF